LYQINVVLMRFHSLKNRKNLAVSIKMLSSTTVFNIDDNKCFLRTKSAY